jgi:hypothetical protein
MGAQEPADPYQPVRSVGLPPRLAAYGGVAAAGRTSNGFSAGALTFLGVRHELLRPVIGLFGLALEGYGGAVGGKFEGGGRLFGTVRAALLQAGVEMGSPNPWPPHFTMALEDPIVRGGVLGPGGMIRLEWTPAAHRLGLGLALPLLQPLAGRTRSRGIALPTPPHPAPLPRTGVGNAEVDQSLDQLRTSALWIDLLTTPFLESALKTDREWKAELESQLAYMSQTNEEFPAGHTYPAEVAAYHRRLGRLFREAIGMGGGAEVAAEVTALARRVLLEEVVLPANRHFGTLRGRAVFAAFRARAAGRFEATLQAIARLPPGGQRRVLDAFIGWLEVVEAVERAAQERWDDSRLIWLPFQLALTPDQHDSQPEVDDLLERLVGEPIQGGNDYAYLINEAFSPELIRSIHEARDYHVLWIHDFPGIAPGGKPDRIAARVAGSGYLAALARRVREFDQTGRLPAFMIFLDQWYFDIRSGRWWMSLLADPLGPDISLPQEGQEVEEEVRTAQHALREAVAGSARLQALARERGEGWLRRYVKVHVNITFPGDPSFRRRIPARDVPLLFADDYMRDHKKVVFWDLTERDPTRGAAIFTGEGVGENYEGARWEDRTLLVRGPAALALKREARALLGAHGIPDDEIPPPLRAERLPANYRATVDSLSRDWTTRLVQVHSATGYGPKPASALKAALYNLAPAGSRLLIPDSQWSSFFWAGMLAGTALRGNYVFVIAPKTANAPYGGAFVQNVLTHDVLEAYLQIREALRPVFTLSRGGLWVGLYGQDIGTSSIRERYHAVLEGMRDPRFPREAFPFPAETFASLGNVPLLDSVLAPVGDRPVPEGDPNEPRLPQLHLKSQLFASGEGLERVLQDPGWFQVFFTYVETRVREVAGDPGLAAAGRMTPRMLAPVDSALRRAPAAERARDVFYLLSGSQNQNDRSLLLDGELLVLVAGVDGLASLIDFVAIAARSTWVETGAELDALIPRQPRGKVELARSLRSVF